MAANVINGDFESGSLKGWHVHRVIQAGNWFAYKGTDAPIGSKRGAPPVQAPPQGTFAAIADQANPDTLILYQDVALEAGAKHRLGLLVYYNSYEPIAVPTPDTLSVDDAVLGGQSNQQYRIDVMKPGAPLESIDPTDILRNVFRTEPGDPKNLQPTKLTADLSPFAGQTVRLRIANAVHEEVFNAGVDAVSIFDPTSPGGPGSGPGSKTGGADRLALGKPKANRRTGAVTLPVRVPGPGALTARGRSIRPPAGFARAAAKRRQAVKPATARAHGVGVVKIRLRPTAFGRAVLSQRGKLRIKVTVTFKPAGDPLEAVSLPVTFRLAGSRSRR